MKLTEHIMTFSKFRENLNENSTTGKGAISTFKEEFIEYLKSKNIEYKEEYFEEKRGMQIVSTLRWTKLSIPKYNIIIRTDTWPAFHGLENWSSGGAQVMMYWSSGKMRLPFSAKKWSNYDLDITGQAFKIAKLILDAHINNNKNVIEMFNFLSEHGLYKYTINEDLTINLFQDLNLMNCRIKKIPLKFHYVDGDVNCSRNELTSLEWCPEIIQGNYLNISNNKISSIKGLTRIMGYDYKGNPTRSLNSIVYLNDNLLSSTEDWYFTKSHIPVIFLNKNKFKDCKSFKSLTTMVSHYTRISVDDNEIQDVSDLEEKIRDICSFRNNKITEVIVKDNFDSEKYKGNPIESLIFIKDEVVKLNVSGIGLTTLEGFPKTVNGDFDCSNNKLVSLDGGPKTVNGDFDCSNNKLVSLDGGPVEIGGSYICYNNKLQNLDGIPASIEGLDASYNQIKEFPKNKFKFKENLNQYYLDMSHNQISSLDNFPILVPLTGRYPHEIFVNFIGNPKSFTKRKIKDYMLNSKEYMPQIIDQIMQYLRVNVQREYIKDKEKKMKRVNEGKENNNKKFLNF